ncbi:hypothetical protein [uncultured Erythrobacter sp.]|uniref:hypothetical protein n=1 Tax=uncultured Erythrobacter sp. TaxID=263913 RepID=UPI00260EECCA|nr:hypothetical protein [uncultured Erythrobacter sp.]
MISNFDEVKKQLSELSEVINKFKSEAVQLRIVEIVLGDGAEHGSADDAQNDASKPAPKPGRRKATRSKATLKAKVDSAEAKTSKNTRSSGKGAVATVSELVDNGFFEKPKTINDIVSHCEEKLARRFKSNEFSGKLGRLTREGILDRTKNGDGQYEYTQT